MRLWRRLQAEIRALGGPPLTGLGLTPGLMAPDPDLHGVDESVAVEEPLANLSERVSGCAHGGRVARGARCRPPRLSRLSRGRWSSSACSSGDFSTLRSWVKSSGSTGHEVWE